MAGLRGVTILLLWAGIIGLAKCQNANISTHVTAQVSDQPTKATTASATTNHTKTPLPMASPEDTKLNATVDNTIPAKATTASATTNDNKGPSPLTSPEDTKLTTRVRRDTDVSSNDTTASASTNDTETTSHKTPTNVSTHNTTVNNNTTPERGTTAPPLTCNYTVKSIKFGLRIDITSSAVSSVHTTIMINEEGENATEAIPRAPHSNQSSYHEIKQLKPCTKYELKVTLVDKDEQTPCHCTTENVPMTIGIMKDDIEEANCSSTSGKSVCYRTGWDINSFQTTPVMIPDLQCGHNTVCFKPGFDDICSNITFTLPTCTNISSQFNRSITLDVKSINQTAPTQFPVEFETKLPPKCNLSIDYTCQFDRFNEADKHGPDPSWREFVYKGDKHGPHPLRIDIVSENLSELEPFTDYNCTGHIKDGNNDNVYNTTEVKVRISCDLKINLTSHSTTNTSSQLIWTTTNNGCKDVIQNLSYICSCGKPHGSDNTKVKVYNKPQGGTCNITALMPYKDYTCWVQPYYPREVRSYYIYRPVGDPVSVKQKTLIGVPEDVRNLQLEVKDHNTISITCTTPRNFNGPEGKFKAQLVYGSSIVEKIFAKCEFEFKDLKYSTSYTVKVTAVNRLFESNPVTVQISTEYNDKAVIGFLIFLIILTSVALLLVVYKIWDMRRRKSHDLSENLILISTANDEENLLPVEPIAAELLLEAYKRKLADEARLFLAEFQSIPRIFSRHSVKEAKKSSNVPKNRYVDILPYDYNRVQLTTGNGEAGCDYINASFIDGYKEAKKYIAAQGPKDETLGDFWRMVWEQQSSIIVMVTRCEEGNRVKCSQYWPAPDREAEIFEEFVVKLNSEEICPDYTIRHLSLTNKREKSSDREVTHIQFMSWPDHGVPSEPHLLLKLRRRVNAFKNFFSGPIVVHCSAGVGRTGTYIGIDAMMEAMEVEGRVDIYGYMVRLRRQRCLMVQVEAQYILIHQALVEHNQFGETEIPLSEVHSTLSQLTEKTSESEPTLMEEEFDRVPTFHKWRTVNVGISEENKGKNRPSSVIPYDYNRVLLKHNEGRSHDSDPEDEEEESSDEEDEDSCRYINASHINGYWGPRALIAAQTPLPDTMADFWLMVYQKKVSTLVMLSEENKESEAVYWDKDKRTFGDLEVEVVSTDATPTFIRRNLMIRHVKKTESRSVKQFQFLKWVNRELPETPQCLADMMKEIKKGGGGSKSQTTVVHCNDGSSRSGVFCALWNLLDCAHTEKVIDVFQVVKTLRKERQSMISSLAQYQFLYDTVQMLVPVQNGEVKAVQASAADSIQMISETAAPEQPDSAASSQQQEAEESTHLVAEEGKEDKEEEPGKESPLMEDTSDVPLDV
ncbi:receptor-type tyrosine-protein phosphatase C isoform X2 [Platichthys flesus]|uniref:receptor-type tyrosine-protein phosphatase C isoform X2 n=1 Tax=Platichthys flesus TaxID=8260 RepID=UPI002DB6F95D|nr:receptor-type tyrosine-protein phosphatase C isoform X2 [Platichthys flesus]